LPEPNKSAASLLITFAAVCLNLRQAASYVVARARNAAKGIVGGMSGSPILAMDGSAVGVLSCSGGGAEVHFEGGPEPALTQALPQWLVAELVVTQSASVCD
jgi:hypothetical protein